MQEYPVYIPVNGREMFAILTIPSPGVPDQHTGIILTIGAYMPSFARNRMYVRTAAAFAARGYHVMRVDYLGNGEHSHLIPDQPNLDMFAAEFSEMARFFLEHTTIDRVVMVGSCLSCRIIIESAHRIPGLDGIIALASPATDLWSTAGTDALAKISNKFKSLIARRIAPISANLRACSNRLIDEGVPYLMIYGEEDEYYQEEFLRSKLDAYRSPDGHSMDLVVYPGRVHDYPSMAVQDTVLAKLLEWVPARHGTVIEPATTH